MAKKLRRHGRRWFAFLLCRTAATSYGLDVDRLLNEMPLKLFEEWRTLYEMEPWADERADYAAGAIVASVNKDEGKILEFARKYMPFLVRPPKKPQSEEDMKAAWGAICRAMEDREQSEA